MLPSRLLAAALALCAGAAQAQEKFHVQMPVGVDPRAPLAARECGVEMLLGNFVFQTVSSSFPGAGRLPEGADPGQSKTLKLTILSTHAEGRSVLGGPKSITIRAEVVQQAKLIGTTVLRREAYGGPLGTVGVVGTCQIMENIARALGQDVADWLPKTIVPGMPR